MIRLAQHVLKGAIETALDLCGWPWWRRLSLLLDRLDEGDHETD